MHGNDPGCNHNRANNDGHDVLLLAFFGLLIKHRGIDLRKANQREYEHECCAQPVLFEAQPHIRAHCFQCFLMIFSTTSTNTMSANATLMSVVCTFTNAMSA